jgi:hypothetical protein
MIQGVGCHPSFRGGLSGFLILEARGGPVIATGLPTIS